LVYVIDLKSLGLFVKLLILKQSKYTAGNLQYPDKHYFYLDRTVYAISKIFYLKNDNPQLSNI